MLSARAYLRVRSVLPLMVMATEVPLASRLEQPMENEVTGAFQSLWVVKSSVKRWRV